VALWLPGFGLENGKAKAFVSRPRPGLPRPRPELPRPRPPFSGLKARPRPNIPARKVKPGRLKPIWIY